MADLWTVVRPERAALAADLEVLDEAAWATPSLCPGWSVRDVVAHITALARMTPPRFFGKLLASGLNPSRLQTRDIAREQGASGAETLARFRTVVARRNGLPGQSRTLVGETLVHAEDVRRPLGISHEYPTGALVAVADLYRGSNLVAGSKRRVAGLSLRATDTPWEVGAGPEVSGPILSLVMALAGREAVIADLTGDGVEILRSRT